MSRTVRTIDDLQEYLRGVARRAEHHAQSVDEVILALAGAVVLFKDAGTELEVRTHAGQTANVLWVTVGGTVYALAYNHNTHRVEVREGTTRGRVLHDFDDATAVADIIECFQGLQRGG